MYVTVSTSRLLRNLTSRQYTVLLKDLGFSFLTLTVTRKSGHTENVVITSNAGCRVFDPLNQCFLLLTWSLAAQIQVVQSRRTALTLVAPQKLVPQPFNKPHLRVTANLPQVVARITELFASFSWSLFLRRLRRH